MTFAHGLSEQPIGREQHEEGRSVSSANSGNSSTLTLDQLAALNDEIAALVRAGVPLETGLAQLGRDLPGKLGALTGRLAERMELGASLEQAIAEEGDALPNLYRTMVQAGVRSGRLAVVLEGLAETARALAELRRTTGLALFYPVLLAALALGLFAFFVAVLAPNFSALDLPGSEILHALIPLERGAVWWGTLGPALIVIVAVAWWIASRRSSILDHQRLSRPLAWWPTALKMKFYSRAASVAEVLRLLVEHDVPLDEALRLAGQAGGDPRITSALDQIASALERGDSLGESGNGDSGNGDSHDSPASAINQLPPLLRAAVLCGDHQQRLVRAARHAAEVYRDRAQMLLESSQLLLPIALTLIVGASVTSAFVFVMYVPYVQILHAMALP